jgi:hypothetical protein
LPPPGGGPYFATTSAGARIELVPRIRVFRLVGTLSSSTQMYSGSLGTSPYRGFWIRSHRASADFSSDGSPPGGSPTIMRAVSHPVDIARRAQASRRAHDFAMRTVP